MSYDPEPRYAVVGGEVDTGWDALVRDAVAASPSVVAIDGPAALDWKRFATELSERLGAGGSTTRLVDARAWWAPWEEIVRRTASAEIPGDPVFGRVFDGSLAELLDGPPPEPSHDVDATIVFGPGSALGRHDLLWLAGVPKRLALAAVQHGAAPNVGQPSGATGTEQRLLFVDWPLLDRHTRELTPRLDRYVDLSDPSAPRSLAGSALRSTLRSLAGQPFRVRPAFLPGPWGGSWLQETLGVEPDAPNLAWSYELIAPEAGILLGGSEPVEVGFELLMAEVGGQILGSELARRFDVTFPIRFDYLDTYGGGDLSIQCHPTERYMQETFGLPFTQHETYYVMVTTPGASVFLGLRPDADLAAFRHEAERAEEHGRELDPGRYLQALPAEQHRLYLIPGGTPHASGAGNLVLEISATPYLYTLRFYDWLRRGLDGALRPVHLEHAFANVDPARRGPAVTRDLVPEPRVVRGRAGAAELSLAHTPDLFFAVHRLDFEDELDDDTAGRFHVLNLVAGESVEIETAGGASHPLAYAETIVVPAAVGAYRLRRTRGPACKVVKAFVPPAGT